MKRVAVALFLGLCLLGVLLLLMETAGERVTHREAAGTSSPGAGGAPRTGDLRDAGASAGERTDGAAVDDDPNLIPGPPVTIRGRVVRDDRGVAGAAVTARRARPWFQDQYYSWVSRELDPVPPPIAKSQSDEGGTFELRIARRRAVVLRAMHPGSAPASLRLFLPESGDPAEVTLRLKEGTTLFGIVLNHESQPVADAAVNLSSSGYRATRLTADTKTEPDGRFVFADLADGTFYVLVEAKGYPPTRRSVTLPAATHVQFVLGPGGTVTGTVTDSAGAPLADARVVLTTTGTAGHMGYADVRTGADGQYRIESIRPGPLAQATVTHPRCGVQTSNLGQLTLPTRLVKAGEELRYDIQLRPGVPVRGRTVMADTGAPVAGAQVKLLKLNATWRGVTEVDHAASGADGRFEFVFVTEGTYGLEAIAAGAGRRAVRYQQNNQPLTIDFYVDGERAPPEQRLELVPMGGVRGSVVGYRFHPQRRLLIRMDSPQGSLSGYGDDFGNFIIENVPPMEGAVVQCTIPLAKSDPFTVEAGRVAEVVLDPSGRGGFAGVIEDEQGRPVAGAMIVPMPQSSLRWNLRNLERWTWSAVRSDVAGRFLAQVRNWYYESNRSPLWVVVASHPDYMLGMTKQLNLPKKGETVETRIVLKAAGTIGGRVEFVGGGPAPNLTVTASPKRTRDGQPFETRTRRSAVTDFDGRFEIPGIAEGDYSVSTFHRDGKVETVEACAGDRDLKLVIRPTASIAGFVVDEDGAPVAGARVSAIVATGGKERKHGAVSGQGGRFTITQLEPGAYPLVVERQARGSTTGAGFETKHVDPVPTGTEELVIVVSYGPTLKGRVLGHGGKPVPGAGVIAMPLQIEKKDNPRAQRQAEQAAQQQARPSAITDGRGEFEIKGLGTAEVELAVLAHGHVPATRRAVAGPGQVTVRLEKGGVIEGRVLKADGTPLKNQWFQLRPSGEVEAKYKDWRVRGGSTWNSLGGRQLLQGRTDPSGAFRFQSLLPGEYSPYLQSNEGMLPETKLRTDAGTVTLRLEPPLTVRGQVVGTDGQLIVPKGFQVWINARRGQTYLRGTRVQPDGTFELKGLPPGTVTLQAFSSGRFMPAKVEVTAGDLNVTIVLAARPPLQRK